MWIKKTSFHVEQSEFDICIVIMKCNGKLVHPDCVSLRAAVREQFRLGKKAIILDLQQITEYNDSGIAEIIAAYVQAHNYGSYLSFFWPEVMRQIEKMKYLYVPVPYFRALEDALSDAQSWCKEQNIYDRFADTE